MTFYDEYVCISLEHYNIHIIRVIEKGIKGYSHYDKINNATESTTSVLDTTV